jgi:hypothetical protein
MLFKRMDLLLAMWESVGFKNGDKIVDGEPVHKTSTA